ncbi:TetR/AcrR family transcriptional regulator [Neobacillus sp. MM2021_6]|uniref:TetR/AcrR family transcriptional regulator n=1 Tax=Bacillaceae TaxID=186817 RepID=UPI00140B3B0F|nr:MULTISPECIES: TetR-like C-terminal domain-containing protein [Bacillaceae]MBO0959313.1 TetR/AcrR family transcriptional regulator [Neobacillus sp. MM2021_6]NHC20580.1 TetR/AcrR family transcriptional regulator [Bacillus sp. MM2020_4]
MSNNEKPKVDPRIKRTKKMFKDALISLIQENSDKSKLTVQTIAGRAELNRATFYLHYQDIDDLMEQTIDEVLEELNKTMESPPEDNRLIQKGNLTPRNRLISFIEHFYQNAGLYNVMLENKDFRKRVFSILLDIVTFRAEDRKAKGRATFKVPNEINASATLGIISWWLQEGTPYSPSYLAEQIILMSK